MEHDSNMTEDEWCAVQKPILSRGCLAQQEYWSVLRADTGTLFFPDKIQTKRSQTQLHVEESLFFVKGMMVAPLSTAGVSDEVAQELQMPMGPQMLEDVDEPMPARPTTLRDPGTPDQIVMEQHSLTHFPGQPWCKVCVESRGHDSPHREQSKIDAIAPQVQFGYGYIGDGGTLQIACFLVGADTSSVAIHATMVPDSKKMDMPYVVAATAKWVRDLEYSQHTENQRRELQPVDIRSFDVCEKRALRSEDSILLRHMDDVVGTGPEEHLMSDCEHMKTSLYLTDVVVLRHEGDTVNFLGLEITKTSKGFEVKNSTDLVESLLNLYGLQNSKPTANPGRRSTMVELASATPLDGQEYSNFRTAVGKLIFMLPGRPDMQVAIQQLSTQVLNPTTESQRAVKQLIRCLKGTQHTCLRPEPREKVQKRFAGNRRL